MILDLKTAKDFLRIDQDYRLEDELIQLLIDNAETYILDAVDNFDYTSERQMRKAKLLALVLINDWYENRELIQDGKLSDRVRLSIQSLLLQLQYGSDSIEG
ncbi:head-tail connector protein [Proteiniborus sp. MB09-C3]|uniref:head-tail connector protein n=1 Tax=Proteiniborus sp. MB09-C3 TaxID=3050072 RepID=UPI0025552E48|nr:head-tail connector protein [Proteiniborus sp. MB09-C3]WIV10540.1 head-tail connector protein [Proteiniborus sp. MB09-C3]